MRYLVSMTLLGDWYASLISLYLEMVGGILPSWYGCPPHCSIDEAQPHSGAKGHSWTWHRVFLAGLISQAERGVLCGD